MSNIFTDNFTEEEVKAQDLLEAQLDYTANMIRHLANDHKHYTDDCGDYLMAALDLSSNMANERSNGIDEFVKWLNEIKGNDEFWEQFASDGISPEVYKWLGVQP